MRGYDPVRVTTDCRHSGVSATRIENEHLRLLVLDGKGGDILEFRDKATDVDVLWQTPHDWQTPERPFLAEDSRAAWATYYPGGWQTNLPIAGWGGSVSGTEYGLHGESALVPWTTTVLEDSPRAVRVRLAADLVRYPFRVEREVSLAAGERTVEFHDTITNEGAVPLEYIWQQHVALGPPLVGPQARLDVPAQTGVVEESYDTPTFEHSRLAAGERFDWPHAPAADGGEVDLRTFPPYDSRIHDQVYATDLSEGWYAVTNPEVDLGFALSFPVDPYECLWYWQPFGGIDESPYFGRNYNVGLEPTSAYPAGSIPDAQRANGTINTLDAGEQVEATVRATLYHGLEAVESVSRNGSVEGSPSA